MGCAPCKVGPARVSTPQVPGAPGRRYRAGTTGNGAEGHRLTTAVGGPVRFAAVTAGTPGPDGTGRVPAGPPSSTCRSGTGRQAPASITGVDRPGIIRGSPGRTLGDHIDDTLFASGATPRHYLPPCRLACRRGDDRHGPGRTVGRHRPRRRPGNNGGDPTGNGTKSNATVGGSLSAAGSSATMDKDAVMVCSDTNVGSLTGTFTLSKTLDVGSKIVIYLAPEQWLERQPGGECLQERDHRHAHGQQPHERLGCSVVVDDHLALHGLLGRDPRRVRGQ